MSHLFAILLVLSALPCTAHAAHISDGTASVSFLDAPLSLRPTQNPRGRAETAPATLLATPSHCGAGGSRDVRAETIPSGRSDSSSDGSDTLTGKPLSSKKRRQLIIEKWLVEKIAPIFPREKPLVKPRLTTSQSFELELDLAKADLFSKDCPTSERERLVELYSTLICGVVHYCRLSWAYHDFSHISTDEFNDEVELLNKGKNDAYKKYLNEYAHHYLKNNKPRKATI